MTKVIASLVFASFVLTLAYVAPAGAAALEKIPSPDQIKNFRVMEKVGNALYGIRLGAVKTEAPAAKNALVQEKIPAPHLISAYENIRQVGNALWGTKKAETNMKSGEAERNQGSVPAAEAKKVKPTRVTSEMATCVLEAINAKDEALSVQILAAAQEVRQIITARNTCQRIALSVQEDQGAEMEACARVFQEGQRAARVRHKEAHDAIWREYREALQTCRPAGAAEKEEVVIDDGGSMTAEMMTDISVR